jgi:hypothetical protein
LPFKKHRQSPLPQSQTCQCTQCRRNTGSLFFSAHAVPVSSFAYTTPTTTLKNYYATAGCQRGFCTECGSFLYWNSEGDDTIELAVGCFDPEFLFGEEGAGGRGGFGLALAGGRGTNFWCLNEIKGVTDQMLGGRKLTKDSTNSNVLSE